MTKNRTLKILFSLLIPIFLFSCGEMQAPDVIWPGPPNQPRIKYIQNYYGPTDIVKKSFVLDTILGAEGGVGFSKPMGLFYDNVRDRLIIA
ncbi:MAG: hypothetical protein IME98_05470, partial [Proteobacteria bacterium]|nr:hypothetical protein [Pseudomonadota bacterium]